MYVGMCIKTIASLDRSHSLIRSAVYAGGKVFSRDFLSVDENVLCLHRGASGTSETERSGRSESEDKPSVVSWKNMCKNLSLYVCNIFQESMNENE